MTLPVRRDHVYFPGSLTTDAWQIDDLGVIVGDFSDADGFVHGYVLKNGRFTRIDQPGPNQTSTRGINLLGTIVGLYATDEDAEFGLIVRGGTTESFEVPGDAQLTEAYSINVLGVIVGDYADADGMFHGFVRIPGR